MKSLFLFLIAILIYPVQAQDHQESDSVRNMLIITCHPDDWELSMAGTAYLLKDKYNIHVIIASDGERGNSKEPDPEVAALRVGHAMKSAEKINAQNHFFRMMDGEIYADEDAVQRTVKLMEDLDPALIFLHWPIDKPDHAAASAMAMMALSKTGMMYNREIYFFEVGLLNHFTPEVFVDVTPVWEIKKEVVQIHERFNDDRYERMAERSSLYHGRTNRCKYAEGFIPLFPFSNVRYKNRIGCSLLDL
ncbi:MAG: hypothetical protein DRI98_07385 [Bacteroidetes bacterium]|nr:MAG: hypothetical protein DRI98_07385 [Bacteroidota bacterium]